MENELLNLFADTKTEAHRIIVLINDVFITSGIKPETDDEHYKDEVWVQLTTSLGTAIIVEWERYWKSLKDTMIVPINAIGKLHDELKNNLYQIAHIKWYEVLQEVKNLLATEKFSADSRYYFDKTGLYIGIDVNLVVHEIQFKIYNTQAQDASPKGIVQYRLFNKPDVNGDRLVNGEIAIRTYINMNENTFNLKKD